MPIRHTPSFSNEDLKLRKYIKDRLYAASVSRIQIERAANRIRITIHTARPGMVIGVAVRRRRRSVRTWRPRLASRFQ